MRLGGRGRAPIRAFEATQGEEEESCGEVHSVIASVELDDAGYNLQTGVAARHDAEETDDEIEAGDDEAEFLACGRPGFQRDAEQDETKDEMGEIVSERVMVLVMAAGDVKESKDPKGEIENARDDQECFTSFPPHSP